MPPSLHLWAMKKREEEEEEGVCEVGSGQEDKLLQGYNRRAERNKYPSCFWGRERDRDSLILLFCFKRFFNVGFEFISGVGLFAFGADIKKI